MAKVITIMQPFAHLACLGAKKIETRSWVTRHTGELFIHASLRWEGWALDLCYEQPYKKYIPDAKELTLGAIIGKVNVTGMQPCGEIMNELSKEERAFGFFAQGRYAWFLEDAVLFEKPIPARGNQGLWNFDVSKYDLSPKQLSHA